MSRLFWLGLGVAAGVMVNRKVTETARQLTPAGAAANVGDALRELASAVGAFGAEVRLGMAEREHELHDMVQARTGIPTDVRAPEVVSTPSYRALPPAAPGRHADPAPSAATRTRRARRAGG